MRWGNPNVAIGPEDRGDNSHLYGHQVLSALKEELEALLQTFDGLLRLVENEPARRTAAAVLSGAVDALDLLEDRLARYGENEEGEAEEGHEEAAGEGQGHEALNEALAALTAAREGRRRQLAALNARVAELADHVH